MRGPPSGNFYLQDPDIRLAENNLRTVVLALREDGLRNEELVHYYRDEVVEGAIVSLTSEIGMHLEGIRSNLEVVSEYLLKQPQRRRMPWYTTFETVYIQNSLTGYSCSGCLDDFLSFLDQDAHDEDLSRQLLLPQTVQELKIHKTMLSELSVKLFRLWEYWEERKEIISMYVS